MTVEKGARTNMKKLLMKFKKRVFLSILMIAIASATNIYSGYVLTHYYDILTSNNIKSAVMFAGIMIFWKMVYVVVDYATSIYVMDFSKCLKIRLRDDIVEKITRFEMHEYQKKEPGEYSSWLINDVNLIDTNAIKPFFEMIGSATLFVFAFVTLMKVHWIILVVAIFSALLMYLVPQFYGDKINDLVERISKLNESFSQKAMDNFSGFETFVQYNKKKELRERFRKSYTELENENFNLEKKKISMDTSILTVFRICEAFLMVLTAILAFLGWAEVGTVFIVSNIATRFFNSILNLSSNIIIFKSSRKLFQKFDDLSSEQLLEEHLKLEDKIKVKKLSLYFDETNVFKEKDFCFSIKGKYAIVGESGCGKSTLMKALSGLHKGYTGEIQFDAVDIKEYSATSINSSIAYVSQSVYMFNDTIRFNLTMGDDIDDEKIMNALEFVNLREFVEGLENGLETILADKGKNLSGGQRQRLSLVRALLSNKEIFLLDEATSALDKYNSKMIESRLLKNPNYTVIMITHHLDEEIESLLTQKVVL
jgi:ABC-type multidrug transport system fused ATPase/permease subunit